MLASSVIVIFYQRYTERAISVLINFTQDEYFRKQIVELKGATRIIETLTDHVLKYDYLSKTVSYSWS